VLLTQIFLGKAPWADKGHMMPNSPEAVSLIAEKRGGGVSARESERLEEAVQELEEKGKESYVRSM